jgi:hypothetical protein
MLRHAFAVLLALSSATAAPADPPQIPVCSAPFGRLLADSVFRAYPVREAPRRTKWAAPSVKTGQARLYRTVIREEAKLGPDFAGHYKLVRIGCGAATVCVAMLDAATGKVSFPPKLKSATALLFDTGRIDVEILNYRRNSRLLIVAGSPNEDERRTGLSYYLWSAGELRLVRFVPAATLCGMP